MAPLLAFTFAIAFVVALLLVTVFRRSSHRVPKKVARERFTKKKFFVDTIFVFNGQAIRKIRRQLQKYLRWPGPAADTFPHFLNLPLELRNRIYEYMMTNGPSSVVIPESAGKMGMELSKFTLLPKALPNVCYTSHRVHLEATLAFIRCTRFIIPSTTRPLPQTALIRWLNQFPSNQGFSAVRRIGFDHNMRKWLPKCREPTYIPLDWTLWQQDFVEKCDGLTDLVMHFDNSPRGAGFVRWLASNTCMQRLRRVKLVVNNVVYRGIHFTGIHCPLFVSSYGKLVKTLGRCFAHRRREVKVEFEVVAWEFGADEGTPPVVHYSIWPKAFEEI
ncbi:hypothetical protein EJ04DRAFT_582342 [Polyplosphaeria fusca]|uniref:Uncharacterized protein n=1 Tax=Polyplosphaeria fusca TaxID=682080 RepID=A0A9P4QIN0_9PLEO|nr:hypothetical protein EJ04DRAFT_582342 [Polyplosphaeria fusca]